MARRKASDKKGITKKSRAAGEEASSVQADNYSIAFEQVQIGGDVGGDIRIGHTIGYTADQVSVLLKQITTTLRPKSFDGRCPYKGLEVFEEEDAELFFGRERLVNELVGHVKESRTVFITGPSGSGKSSLVRAGLIHALKQGAIKSSDRWLYETLKPGREPIKDLALAFSRLKSPELEDYFLAHSAETDILNKCAESVLSGRKDQRFVLFIDQFEEVFTQVNQEEDRVAFINMLAHAGTVENGRVIVLFAMRSDFVSNCATYPALNELLSQEFRQIGAMQPEELVSAIALPARHVGLPVENELIAQIINDMRGEPDALPLMQFALKDLFDAKQPEGGVIALTLKDYLQHGGIHKSLERHADATFAKLSENEQELTRSIFSGLIEIGRGTQDTKRTAMFDELIPASAKSEDVLAIVQKLADARLIITDEQAGKDTVTISHEKLIEAWPWLKKLVNENRDVIALQNEIATDAKEWEDHEHDPSYLYSGTRLANISEQLAAKKLVLSETSNEFVNAGQAQEKRNRRIRIMGVAVPVGLVIVAVILFSYISSANSARLADERLIAVNTQAALVSTSESIAVTAQAAAEEAQKQVKIARARELAAQSIEMREKNLQISLLLGIEAFRTWNTPLSKGALLDATNANPQMLQIRTRHSDEVPRIAISPDGKLFASANNAGLINLWDVPTNQLIGQLPYEDADRVWSIAFSPDSKILASIVGGFYSAEKVMLWDVNRQQPIGQLLPEQVGSVREIAFSPNGAILASGHSGGIIMLWDATTGKRIGEPLTGNTSDMDSLAFSPDGKTLAIGMWKIDGGIITLWDVDSQQSLGQLPTGLIAFVPSIAFSPDGKTLASIVGIENQSMVMLWDVEKRQRLGEPLSMPTSSFTSIAFSPDSKTLASGGWNGIIMLWDVATRQRIGEPLIGHTSSVLSIVFLNATTFISGGSDNASILWHVEARQPISQPIGPTWSVNSVAFSPDSNILASGIESDARDGMIMLWDVAKRQRIGEPLTGQSGVVASVALSPDGKTLASGGEDGEIMLWDVATHQSIGQLPTRDTNYVFSVVFSPDGKILASGGTDSTITLWDVASHQSIGQLSQALPGDTSHIDGIAFSPDGKILASVVGGEGKGMILLWDVATRQRIGQPLTPSAGYAVSIAFSPDGKSLASGSNEGMIMLWDVPSQQPIGRSLAGHGGVVASVAFSPDGKTLASGGYDATIILWDVDTHQPIGQPLITQTLTIFSLAFSPNGKMLASGGPSGQDRTLIIWNINPEYWIEQSCQRVGRNFTRIEWEQYFPNEEYRKTCNLWPLEPDVVPTTAP